MEITKKQRDKFSDFLYNLVLLLIATVVLPALLQKFNLMQFIFGILVCIILIIFAFKVSK